MHTSISHQLSGQTAPVLDGTYTVLGYCHWASRLLWQPFTVVFLCVLCSAVSLWKINWWWWCQSDNTLRLSCALTRRVERGGGRKDW